MTGHAFEVETRVRQRAAHLGPEGRQWLADLPDLVADLERLWSITVGEPLSGGSASYVARARTADGRHVVLKLALPEPDFAGQVSALGNARGRGYVHLLASDLRRRALLLEGLGPSLNQMGLPPEAQIDILCVTLRQAWELPRPANPTLSQAQVKARQLAELVDRRWNDLGRPCSERVVTRALTFAERRAAGTDLGRAVVVHGDPHPGNALRVRSQRAGAESGFVFVDPDGFLADPAYDLGGVLREWCPQLLAGDAPSLARRYCRLLAMNTGIDPTAIWEWGFLERVSTGLYMLDYGAEVLGRAFLDTAEKLA